MPELGNHQRVEQDVQRGGLQIIDKPCTHVEFEVAVALLQDDGVVVVVPLLPPKVGQKTVGSLAHQRSTRRLTFTFWLPFYLSRPKVIYFLRHWQRVGGSRCSELPSQDSPPSRISPGGDF